MTDFADPAPRPAGAPLRVLVTSYRSNPHVGGQGIYVRELTRALAAEGCIVSVASGPPYPELDPGIELIELPSLDLFSEDNAFLALRPRHLRSPADVYEWAAHNTGAFAEMTSFGLRLERFLAGEGHRFDVIHDNQTLSPAFVRIDQRLPVITTLHHPIGIDRDYAVAGATTRLGRLLARRWHSFIHVQARTARQLNRFVAVSDASRRSYAERCGVDPRHVEIAFNGLDLDAFKPDPTVNRDPNHLVALASADVPIKGLDVLIEALAQLKARGVEPSLTVVGSLREGPTKRALTAAGLLDHVRFVSGLSQEELIALYRRATAFVSASRFEGFGFPAAEAMACGAPVLVSDGGALPEVAGDAGIITQAGDATALADALAQVLDDEDLRARMSAASASRAATAFRWSTHAQTSIALYEQALGRGAGTVERLAAE